MIKFGRRWYLICVAKYDKKIHAYVYTNFLQFFAAFFPCNSCKSFHFLLETLHIHWYKRNSLLRIDVKLSFKNEHIFQRNVNFGKYIKKLHVKIAKTNNFFIRKLSIFLDRRQKAGGTESKNRAVPKNRGIC
jgi:hypothetical protein